MLHARTEKASAKGSPPNCAVNAEAPCMQVWVMTLHAQQPGLCHAQLLPSVMTVHQQQPGLCCACCYQWNQQARDQAVCSAACMEKRWRLVK